MITQVANNAPMQCCLALCQEKILGAKQVVLLQHTWKQFQRHLLYSIILCLKKLYHPVQSHCWCHLIISTVKTSFIKKYNEHVSCQPYFWRKRIKLQYHNTEEVFQSFSQSAFRNMVFSINYTAIFFKSKQHPH